MSFRVLVPLLMSIAACGGDNVPAPVAPTPQPSATTQTSESAPALTTASTSEPIAAPPPTPAPSAAAAATATIPASGDLELEGGSGPSGASVQPSSPNMDNRSVHELQTTIMAAKGKHRACFTRWVTKYPEMSTVVRIRLTVTESGKVKDTRIIDPAPGEAKIPQEARVCHLGVARAMVFGKAGAPVTVSYPVHFAAPSPPTTPSPAPIAAPADPTTSSSASADLALVRAKLKRCYLAALEREPSLVSRQAVRIVVAPSGSVQSVTFLDPTPAGAPRDDATLQQCLATSIRSLTFPPSPKGSTVTLPP